MTGDDNHEPGLSARDLEVLEFERLRFKYAGAKEAQIMERWGWSSARYYQLLHVIVDRPEALEYDAQLVNRIRRLREQRQQQRRAGRFGFDV